MPSKRICSFQPIIDKKSKILILGTMPGPEALRRQEYYGFPGNHFWKIMYVLFSVDKPLEYSAKIKLLTDNHIALWDVFQSCERKGALDSAIQNAQVNDIPALLKQYPNIRAIFLNSKAAEKMFQRQFSGEIKIPSKYLPSTSPAHASLSLSQKAKAWSVILKSL